MINRRQFLTGSIASLPLCYRESSASESSRSPLLLAATKDKSRGVAIMGLSKIGESVMQVPLQSRGHSFAINPKYPHWVSVPPLPRGDCIVFDQRGKIIVTIAPEKGRQFYGHGVFDRSGRFLYVTENDIETGDGKVGVYDRTADYKRFGEFDSFGIAPHQIELSNNGENLIIANSELKTHPDTGGRQLNPETMRPSLVYIDIATGKLKRKLRLAKQYRFNTIRHFTIMADGSVYIVLQNKQQKGQTLLLAKYDATLNKDNLTPMLIPDRLITASRGYLGDIAVDREQQRIVVSSRYGGLVAIFNLQSELLEVLPLRDVSGLRCSMQSQRVFAIAERGNLFEIDTEKLTLKHLTPSDGIRVHWENHLVMV